MYESLLNNTVSDGAHIPELSQPRNAWTKFTGMIVLDVVAVIGNALLIFTVVRHKHLRTNTNAFIVSLATADFLFAFPTIPFYIVARSASSSLFGQPLSTICLVAMSATAFQMVVTITTLLALNFERYLCILYPLKHRQWAQRRHVACLVVFVWVYAAFVGALPLMGWNSLEYNRRELELDNKTDLQGERCIALRIVPGSYIGFIYVMHIFPVCVLLPFFYVRMFLAIRKFVARKSSHSSLDTDIDAHLLNGKRVDRTQEQRNSAVRRSSRRSLRLLVVVAVYAICSWIPNLIWYAVATRGFTRQYLTSEMIESIPIPVAVYHVASTLGFANSAVNPYIYGLGNVPIRRAFMNMFFANSMSKCKTNTHGQNETQSRLAAADVYENTMSQTRLPNISSGSDPNSHTSAKVS